MYNLRPTAKFQRDLKRIQRRGYRREPKIAKSIFVSTYHSVPLVRL